MRGQCGRTKSAGRHAPAQQCKREYYLNGTYMVALNLTRLDILNAWSDPVLEASFGNLPCGQNILTQITNLCWQ